MNFPFHHSCNGNSGIIGSIVASLAYSSVGIALCTTALLITISGCVLPMDIDERPPVDTDGDREQEVVFDYWPDIRDAKPSRGGEVIISTECTETEFRIELAEQPDEDDLDRINGLEIRWFLNYSSNPNIVQIDTLFSEQVYRLKPNSLDPETVYALDVVISDIGFVGGGAPNKQVPPEAHVTSLTWVIRLVTDVPCSE